jgi:hypothetical protein
VSYNISFFNVSQAVSDPDLQTAVADLQTQVTNDFAPSWGVDAQIDIGGFGWPITILDYPGPNDPQGALGYHSLDSNYEPYGVVFAQLAIDNGVPWTGVASHEMLEILADPLINSTCFIDNGDGTGWLIAQEVCDPTEQQLYYEIGGTQVSDFALRGWFIPGYPGQVDFCGVVPGPLQLGSGDYISVDYIEASTGWYPVTGDQVTKMGQRIRQRIEAVQPPASRSVPPVRIQALPNGVKQGFKPAKARPSAPARKKATVAK